MKFETIKKMEETVKNFTSKEQLDGDITVMSQGNTIVLKQIGSGQTLGITNMVYMSDETADSYRIAYEVNTDKTIKVIETKLTRN